MFRHLAGWELSELSLSTKAAAGGAKLWGITLGLLLVDTLEFLADVADLSAGAGDGGSVTVLLSVSFGTEGRF